MKILFVTPYLPGPPTFGGQRRMHGLLAALASSHEVSLLSRVNDKTDEAAGMADARRFCREVVAVPDPLLVLKGNEKRLKQAQSVLSTHSFEHIIHTRPAVQRALDEHLSMHSYDIINCEFSFMCGYNLRKRGADGRHTRHVLDAHNVEYDILRRTAVASKLGRKIFHAVNYPKLRREEVKTWKTFDGCAFPSERDANLARSHAPSMRTAVVPNGVDGEYFKPRAGDTPVPNTVLFFGAINYWPNTDAVIYFLRKVLPLLLKRNPNVTVRIVGVGAPPAITEMASERVQVVGFVDDLREEIARAAVVVAPLRIGGGTRLKIIEAMSVGKAVVSTTIGAEGLDITHGKDILLSDTSDGLAQEIDRVLRDPQIAQRLGSAARRTTDEKYSWKAAAQRLSEFFDSLLVQ